MPYAFDGRALGGMVTDQQIRRLFKLSNTEKSQEMAAAKAGMDALAVQYARELSRWGIETAIVVPGTFTRGTNHFAAEACTDGWVKALPRT